MADISNMTEAQTRRELRKRRLLMNSEDRMKKILGQDSHADVDKRDEDRYREGQIEAQKTFGSLLSDKMNSTSENCTHNNLLNSAVQNTSEANYRTGDWKSDQSQDNSNVSSASASTQMPQTKSASAQIDETTAASTNGEQNNRTFNNIRSILFLVAGILIRISLLYSFGQEYVQTILNPFLALEVTVIGFQTAVGMDLGQHVSGGLWLSTLVLTGVNQELIQVYKTMMGVSAATVEDFAVCFFGFMVGHALV